MVEVSKRRWGMVLALVAVLGIVAAACSSDDEGGEGSASGSTASGTTAPDTSTAAVVNSTVKDFAIALDPTSEAAGEIKFEITNEGPSEHEFVVLQTDLAPDALPVDGDSVSEETEGVVNAGEVEDIASGTTESLALTLDPGNYVVICNLPGHYAQGMRTGFTVT